MLRAAEKNTKKAHGTPLGRSHLGGYKTHVVGPEDLTRWFNDRHRGTKANTRKRGASTRRQFVIYCVARGWMEKGMLLTLPDPAGGDTTRNWLTPEAVSALIAAIDSDADPMFDDYWRFSFRVDLETGVRPKEKLELKPGSLDIARKIPHIEHGSTSAATTAATARPFHSRCITHPVWFALPAQPRG